MFYGQEFFNEAFWGPAFGFLALSPTLRRVKARSLLVDAFWPTRAQRNVLIVGTNSFARRVAEEIGHHSRRFQVLGFVGEEAQIQDVVADLGALSAYLRDHVVDDVVVALSADQPTQIRHAMQVCEEQGITFRLLSPEVNPIGAMTVPVKAIDTWAGDAKRALDIAISLMMMITLAPLLLLTAAAIKITSPGPIFFVQKRVGFGKRHFPLFKFRTMVVDAEAQLAKLEALNEAEGPVFKIARDPRITSIGTFLRKTSIDELPQLLNILRGEMSLVGPRPLPIRDVKGFKEDWHRRRFTVKPGLTCLWQISGRSNVSFEQWMELDMDYIDSWSLGLDLQILARTVPVVLKGTGAT